MAQDELVCVVISASSYIIRRAVGAMMLSARMQMRSLTIQKLSLSHGAPGDLLAGWQYNDGRAMQDFNPYNHHDSNKKSDSYKNCKESLSEIS